MTAYVHSGGKTRCHRTKNATEHIGINNHSRSGDNSAHHAIIACMKRSLIISQCVYTTIKLLSVDGQVEFQNEPPAARKHTCNRE